VAVRTLRALPIALALSATVLRAQSSWRIGAATGASAPIGPLHSVITTGFDVDAHALRTIGDSYQLGGQLLFSVMGNPSTNGHLSTTGFEVLGTRSFRVESLTPYFVLGPGIYQTAETVKGEMNGVYYESTGRQRNGGGVIGAGLVFGSGRTTIPVLLSYRRISTAKADFRPVSFMNLTVGLEF
jgi:hypothetical protein